MKKRSVVVAIKRKLKTKRARRIVANARERVQDIAALATIGSAAIGARVNPSHLVQFSTGPNRWKTNASFPHLETAKNYAKLVAKSNPTKSIRVFTVSAAGRSRGKKSTRSRRRR